jgi:hypothetical protein
MWATAIGVAVGLQPGAAGAQEIETIFAIPSQSLTFATHYVAHDTGFFKKEGVKVTDRYLVGVASPNAQKVSLVAKLLDPKDALTNYDGLFSDELVKPGAVAPSAHRT